MKRARSKSGFTLLELVLVLVIAATALAIAAPNLRGWRRGAELRTTMDQMLTLTRYARSEAIAKGRMFRLEFDENQQFQLKMQQHGYELVNKGLENTSDTAGFAPVPGDWGRVYRLPEGSRLEINKGPVTDDYQERSAKVIDFYPTGRTQAATIQVTDAEQFVVVLQCKTPAGNFKWVTEGGSQ